MLLYFIMLQKLWETGQNITNEEIEKFQSETFVMGDEDCVNQLFEYLKSFQNEHK